MNKLDQYFDFLQQKFPIAEISGFVIDTDTLHPMLKPHQKELVKWALYGGRRARSLAISHRQQFAAAWGAEGHYFK